MYLSFLNPSRFRIAHRKWSRRPMAEWNLVIFENLNRLDIAERLVLSAVK